MVFDLDTFKFKRGWGAYGHKLSEITTDDKDREYTPNGPVPKEFRGHLTLNISNDGLVYAADRMANRIDVTDERRQLREGIRHGAVDGRRRLDGRRDVLARQGAAVPVYFRSHQQPRLVPQPRGWQGRGHPGEHGPKRGQFFGLHMDAMDSKGVIYTGEVFAGERVQKFVPVK